MKLKVSVCLLLLIIAVEKAWMDCSYIKNVEVEIRPGLSVLPFGKNKNVSGCIDYTKFPNENFSVIIIKCANAEITKLGQQSIKDMQDLKFISIHSCPIGEIEPQAFFNVPLQGITINNSLLNEIRKGVFDKTTLLAIYLTRNKIDYIEDFAFSNLPQLNTVNLSFNHLRYISPNWFVNSTEIMYLYLTHNFLTKIQADRYRHLPKLRKFYLNHNQISVIEPNAFGNFSNLKALRLSNNHLTVLSPNIFSNKLKAVLFDVRENLLNVISDEFFKDMINKGLRMQLLIAGNPIKCPCLNQIFRWMLDYPSLFDIIWKHEWSRNCQNTSLLPICVADKKSPQSCSESVSEELTEKYLKAFKSICPKTDTSEGRVY